MMDCEQLLDELSLVVAKAAVDRLLAEQTPQTARPEGHDSSGLNQRHERDTNYASATLPRNQPDAT